jgi:hypothetical protein
MISLRFTVRRHKVNTDLLALQNEEDEDEDELLHDVLEV